MSLDMELSSRAQKPQEIGRWLGRCRALTSKIDDLASEKNMASRDAAEFFLLSGISPSVRDLALDAGRLVDFVEKHRPRMFPDPAFVRGLVGTSFFRLV